MGDGRNPYRKKHGIMIV